MSSHIGISCDSCLKTNFSGRRYKCLLCDNYDLCGLCYDTNCESQNHLNIHPMQCILTKAAYELFYSGESIPYQTIVSLVCPYCCVSGFLPHTLLIHCLEKHSNNKTSQMCPICVINPIQGHQNRFSSLADHISKEHIDEKEDFDQDEDEGLPLYILDERSFFKEENRRTINNSTSQRRILSRNSRGNMRGHFNNYPYERALRTTVLSDPYATILFSQSPLFDFDSNSITIAPFFLTSSTPTCIPSLEPITNEQIVQKKSNNKQKRSNHIEQQLLTEPSASDHFSSSFNNLNLDKSIENNPRSLLGKILKIDNASQSTQEQDRVLFLQSLFLSSLNISINKEHCFFK